MGWGRWFFIEEDQLGCDILNMFRGPIQGVYLLRTTTKGSDELLRSCLGALPSHPGAPESKSSLVFVKKSLKWARDCLSTNVTAHIYNDISYLNVSLLLYIYIYMYMYIFIICIDIVIECHRCRCHSYPWILVSSNALLSPIGRLGPFDDLFGHPRSASHRHPAQHAQQGAPMSLSENGVQPWWKLAANPWEILQTLAFQWENRRDKREFSTKPCLRLGFVPPGKDKV